MKDTDIRMWVCPDAVLWLKKAGKRPPLSAQKLPRRLEKLESTLNKSVPTLSVTQSDLILLDYRSKPLGSPLLTCRLNSTQILSCTRSNIILPSGVHRCISFDTEKSISERDEDQCTNDTFKIFSHFLLSLEEIIEHKA